MPPPSKELLDSTWPTPKTAARLAPPPVTLNEPTTGGPPLFVVPFGVVKILHPVKSPVEKSPFVTCPRAGTHRIIAATHDNSTFIYSLLLYVWPQSLYGDFKRTVKQ